MKVYRCKQRFFCTPLKRYLPIGALVARYENVTRIIIVDAPQTDKDVIFNIMTDGLIYELPKEVTWFYSIEPPNNTAMFDYVTSKDEDAYGNVSATNDGLPVNSMLKISGGVAFLQNVNTNLWHAIRVSGPDGNVTLDIAQNGTSL